MLMTCKDEVREVLQTEQANLTQLAEDVKVAKTTNKIRGIFSIVEGIMSVLSGGLTVGVLGTAVKDILAGYTMPVERSPNTHAQLQKGCILHPRAVYS